MEFKRIFFTYLLTSHFLLPTLQVHNPNKEQKNEFIY